MGRPGRSRRLVFAAVSSVLIQAHLCPAANDQVQIDEVLAGANGDSTIQFIELRFCCTDENLWGPQGAEPEGRARLVFYDATGAQTGEFVFSGDPPVGVVDPINGGYSVLVATQSFMNTPGMPTPDVLITPKLIAQGGKVCFKHNPDNPNAEPVNVCLSYGNFAGDTEQDTLGQPAGAPAAAAPIVNASGLKRTQNFGAYGTGHLNVDFALSATAPRNSDGETGSITIAATVEQGFTLFTQETFLGNGRTCLTCHRPDKEFGLPVSLIATLPPSDPLFVAETNPQLAALENPCLMRSRGLILENIDGFENPHVFRGSPHLHNVDLTAPYGQSGEFAGLKTFSTAAVRQHLPRTLARNDDPSVGPMDFRLPTDPELTALEAFMRSIVLPSDGDFSIDRMLAAAVARGADAEQLQRGRDLFTGPAKCFLCHGGPVLAHADISIGGGGNRSFDTGISNHPMNLAVGCLGGAPLPPEAGGQREFSTPSLIGVVNTAPYFHNNTLPVLSGSVEFYTSSIFNASPAGILVGGITLSVPNDVDDLTAFLTALVEPDVVDCNTNSVDDAIDISQGVSLDCNNNAVPDECDLASADCNGNGTPDDCDTAPVILAPFSVESTGDGPFAVTVADLNNDQFADLISANWHGGSVTVHLSVGDGSFVAGGSFAVGVRPHAVVAVDLDNDGNLDIATANLASNNVSVLRNNGLDGGGGWLGFSSASSFAVGSGPLSLVAADFNGDSRPDLATANNISNDASVLLNNGMNMGVWQGMAPAVHFATGIGPWFITAGRIDADSDVDLAVVNRSDNTATVRWNNGSGSFPTSKTLATGTSPESIVAADLDGDWVDDLAVANFDADTLSVLMSNGDTTFSAAAIVGVGSYPFGAAPRFVCAADMDGDGDLDLVAANQFSDNVSILINDGAGALPVLVNLTVGDKPEAAAIGDFDDDGLLDVASAHFSSDTLSTALNLTPPFGGDCNLNLLPDDCDIAAGTLSDFNGNTVPDLCEKLGDVNGDGLVNTTDLGVFVAVLLGQDTETEHVDAADIDGTGTPDGADVEPFAALLLAGV